MICIERIKSLLDSSSDLFQIVSLDGDLLYTNQAWCQRLGYSAAETHNRPLIELIHPTCRDRWFSVFQQVKHQQCDLAIQTSLLAKDGRTVAIAGWVYYQVEGDDPPALWGLWRIVQVEALEINLASPQPYGLSNLAEDCTQLLRQYWRNSAAKYVHQALNHSSPQLATPNHLTQSQKISYHPTSSRLDSLPCSTEAVADKLVVTELPEQELLFRSIYNTAEVAIVVMEVSADQGLCFVGCNPAYERLMGVTLAAVRGKRLEQVLPTAVAKIVRERCLHCAVAQEQMTYEECILWQGEETWWLTNLIPLQPSPSQGCRLLSISSNITEYKRIEAAVQLRNRQLLTLQRISQIALSQRSLKELFHILVETISVVMGFPIVTLEVYDSDRQVMRFEGLKGIPLLEIGSPIEIPADQITSGTVARTGRPVINRYLSESSPCYLNTIFSQLGDIKILICMPMIANQRTFGVLSLAHSDEIEIDDDDVQWISSLVNHLALLIDQKQTEEFLRDAHQKTVRILENVTDAFFTLDHQWQFTYLNSQAEKLLQKKQQSLLEKCIWNVFPEAIDSPFYHQYHKAVSEQVSVAFEAFHPHLNCWFDVRAYPEPSGVSVYFRDVTVRKQAEAELRKTLEREKELNELKSRFVAMVSHEFRTPLTSIQTACELLEHYEWTVLEKQERFQQIYDSIQYMAALLDDVIVVSSIETDQLQFTPELLDLNSFCQRLVAAYKTTVDKHQQLIFVPSNHPCNSWIDPKLLRQILNNLLSNAIKYSPYGGTIRLVLTYQNSNAIFLVQDEGIGIPPDDQKHLFEAFYRARNVNTIAGTGLGMAIVKRCVDLHRGEITVESQPGVGSTFIVTLPMNLMPEKPLN